MQSLRDYLSNTQQYESILDPDQNQVMTRMTDEMIRSRIREYCTYDRQKRFHGELWTAADQSLKITKINKDDKGWYVETKSSVYIYIMSITPAKSFYDYCIAKGQQIDKQKGFLIEDIGVYFRWRRHSGPLEVSQAPNFESTEGLPEELSELYLCLSCEKSKSLDVRNKINVVALNSIEDIKILGKGCKNVIIYPEYPCDSIIAPNGVNIYRPKDLGEYWELRSKLSH